MINSFDDIKYINFRDMVSAAGAAGVANKYRLRAIVDDMIQSFE